MIDLLAVDRWARGDSWLHRASTPAKLLAAGGCIAVLIASRDPLALGVIYAALAAVLLTSRLPVRAVLGLSLLPVTMSMLFAITRLGGTWESALAIVEKGAITSLTMLLLVASTSRTELFGLLRRVMPAVLADMLLLSYRSIFILLGRALDARAALRLRSPALPWTQRLRREALVGGVTLLRANELAADQYAAMRLRGYPVVTHRAVAWRRADVPLLVGAALTFTAALGVAPALGRPLGASLLAIPILLALIARSLHR
ncbi:MAG: cobalt/nickel transport system permease protein [Chloroflexota bacterium]|jgi:energy-coupling factor transporter transmembrane protein EcfT|nr:cobalt/nickel transport system permease protein [Chloroflexota bacterium]